MVVAILGAPYIEESLVRQEVLAGHKWDEAHELKGFHD